MIQLSRITLNPFQENTYILHNENKECIIIDPGCSNSQEEEILVNFISDNNLSPIRLILTHSHIDHVIGAYFVCKKYNLIPENHLKDLETMNAVSNYAGMYGFNYTPPPTPEKHLKEGDLIDFGDAQIQIRFAPGHSPGHIVLYLEKEKFVIGGDVLFRQSIGRTDLPGGNHQELLESIKEKMYTLPDETTVYSGHGPETTIGFEKKNNPFIQA